MNTLVIKSESELVNPPENTPVFSAIQYDPIASFDARNLKSENTAGAAVKVPFSFDGIGTINSRSFDVLNTNKVAPKFDIIDGVACLKFDGTCGLGQSVPFSVNPEFTMSVVFVVDHYSNDNGARILGVGNTEVTRQYVRPASSGIYVSNGTGVDALYISPHKPSGFQCITIKFNGINSKFIGSDNTLVNIELNTIAAQLSSYLRMGSNVSGLTERGFIGKVAGWRLYQDDLTDSELIELHKEMKMLYGV